MSLSFKSFHIWLLLLYVCVPNQAEYLNTTYIRKELLEYLDLGENAGIIRKTKIPDVPDIMKKLYRKMTKSHRTVERDREEDQQELVRLFFPTGMLWSWWIFECMIILYIVLSTSMGMQIVLHLKFLNY